MTFYAGATTAQNGLAAIIPIVSIYGCFPLFVNFFLSLTGFGTKKSGNGFDNRIRLWRWRWRHSRAGIHECSLRGCSGRRSSRLGNSSSSRLRSRCGCFGTSTENGIVVVVVTEQRSCCCLRRDHVSAAKAALKRPLAAAFDGALCGHGQGVFAGEG